MKINLSRVIYIVIVSSIIGFVINFLRPDGISLSREENQLVWADSLDQIKIVDGDSINANPEKSPSKDSTINLKKNRAGNDETSVESFKEPIAINLKQAYELYKKNIVFLDARGNIDYKEGHIKNALNLPYYDFDNCDLSILLGKQLFESGYKKIYIFFGGWNDWLNANYPIGKS